MKPETELWLRRAQGHLAAAHRLFEGQLLAQCIFFCQQSLEVLLKAFLVERSSVGIPRRTHNLASLAQEAELVVSDEDQLLLDLLTGQYTPTRYTDDEIVEYSEDETLNYLQHTERLFSWLQQMLS